MRTAARPSPVSITWSLPTNKLPPIKNEERIATLVRVGGRVLARQWHGVLLAIHKRLVFVSSALWVADAALADALHAANLTPERFLELRASDH